MLKKKTVVLRKKPTSAARKSTSLKKQIKPQKTKATVVRKKKVAAIPKGYHSITPYLIIKNAAHAIAFYKKAFAAKEVMRMEQPNGKIGHAELKIGDAKIMLADEYPEMNARGPEACNGSPVSIHLYIKNVDAVFKKAISAGAKSIRPVEDQFYGDRSGMLKDPFGHIWNVSTHVEDVSKAEMKKRAAKLFSK